MNEHLTLRPDLATCARWSVGAIVLLAFGVWFIADSGGDPVMWSLFGLMVAVATFFLAQLLAPALFELHVDDVGIRARTGWQRLDVPWSQVRSAAIRDLVGEAYLEVGIIFEEQGGWVVRPANVMVPLGADILALRMAIARARAGSQVAA